MNMTRDTQSTTMGEFLIKFEAHEQRDVDRFESTMENMREGFDSIVGKLDEIKNDLREKVQDHETRIRSMERYQWIWMGGAAVGGAVMAQVAGLVLKMFDITPH